MKKKTLYHLSLDVDQIIEFMPRVPESIMCDEDDTIERICLSDSIEKALSAAPWGGAALFDIFICGDFSRLIRVYEFIIDEDNNSLISPEELYRKGLVPDAMLSNEYWYTEKLRPSKSYLIEISYYDEEMMDIINYENYKEIMNDDSLNVSHFIDGSFTNIIDVKYSIVPEENISGIIYFDELIDKIEIPSDIDVDKMLTFIEEDLLLWSNFNYLHNKDGYLEGVLDTVGKDFNVDRLRDFMKNQIYSMKWYEENIKMQESIVSQLEQECCL